jgi:hypothetical protein
MWNHRRGVRYIGPSGAVVGWRKAFAHPTVEGDEDICSVGYRDFLDTGELSSL